MDNFQSMKEIRLGIKDSFNIKLRGAVSFYLFSNLLILVASLSKLPSAFPVEIY